MEKSKETQPEIRMTDQTKAVVEQYLKKQQERKAKRTARKETKIKITDRWDPLTGKFVEK